MSLVSVRTSSVWRALRTYAAPAVVSEPSADTRPGSATTTNAPATTASCATSAEPGSVTVTVSGVAMSKAGSAGSSTRSVASSSRRTHRVASSRASSLDHAREWVCAPAMPSRTSREMRARAALASETAASSGVWLPSAAT